MGTADVGTRTGVWWARALAALAGAALGMAVGHGLVWQTVDPLPDDARARQLAARFVPGEPGEVVRTSGVWQAEPAGWTRVVTGYRELRPGQVSVEFPVDADDPVAQRPHVARLAEQLRGDGWQVALDPDYPILHATRDGWRVDYRPVFRESPDQPPDPVGRDVPQAVDGVAVTIRHDTPAGAGLGLLVGALLGGAVAVAAVVGLQRRLVRHAPATRRRAVVLASVGLGLLAPGTLLVLGLLYLYGTDDLPQEPLWLAYSVPATRPTALLGVALLLVVGVSTARPAREQVRHQRG